MPTAPQQMQPDQFAPADPAVMLASVMAERDAYRERVVTLEAALKPFADHKVKWSDYWPDSTLLDLSSTEPRLMLGDIRRAYEVLYAPITFAIPVEVLASFNPPVVIFPVAPGPTAEGQD